MEDGGANTMDDRRHEGNNLGGGILNGQLGSEASGHGHVYM